MKYNVQLHTGSFFHSNIAPEEARKLLGRVLERIPVDTVIWGWSADQALNRAVSDTLENAGCGSFIWLPVFSETPEGTETDSYVPLFEQDSSGIELSSDEHFEFVCPSSRKNLENAMKMAGAIAENQYVTGIFLDRIRYPSAANSAGVFAGCMCERCRAEYRKYGADPDRLKEILRSGAGDLLVPYRVDGGRYIYEDPAVDGLFRARREIIGNAVDFLSREIHAMGLRVGIDTFSPALADFVGQDLLSLAEHVDLIKPMFYSKTTAPAGIPFELSALEKCFGIRKEHLESLWGCPLDTPSSIARQLEPLRGAAKLISPGVEANSIAGICGSTPEYVLQSRETIEKFGIGNMTLSWNISLIPESLFDIL